MNTTNKYINLEKKRKIVIDYVIGHKNMSPCQIQVHAMYLMHVLIPCLLRIYIWHVKKASEKGKWKTELLRRCTV
jgi:hypothetical protein